MNLITYKRFFQLYVAAVILLGTYNRCISSTPDSLFIEKSGTQLICGGKPFYAIGVNAYYLQNLAAYGDTTHLIEVLQSAKALGITTIRTWGFFDSSDSTNQAVIQNSPGVLNERGLQALDYVIAQAHAYSIRLVIPLVNNWEDYGGMNQYVEWLSATNPSMNKMIAANKQRIINGAEGRSYKVFVSASLTHDDFYINDTIKGWYKYYLQTLLLRTNTITNIRYKDDPAILAWELANEPRSLDATGIIVNQWMDEMSSFIKTIDNHHLVSSGEEGFDISSVGYSNSSEYNNQSWLFDGTTGISFSKNILLPGIDIASIHCYPSAWKLPSQTAILWLKDHQQLANSVNKPLLFGELGSKQIPSLLYKAVLNEAFYINTAGVLLWQLIYPGRPNNDGYAFTCPLNQQICPAISEYTYKFEQKRLGVVSTPATINLFQNYPNPFNIMTLVPYNLTTGTFVNVEIYNGLGELIEVLVNEHETPGYHEKLWSAYNLASGIYYVRLNASGNKLVKKVVLVK